MRSYSSFLVRCWRSDGGDQDRIEVEHVQSGTRAHVSSLHTALEWIDAASRGEDPGLDHHDHTSEQVQTS